MEASLTDGSELKRVKQNAALTIGNNDDNKLSIHYIIFPWLNEKPGDWDQDKQEVEWWNSVSRGALKGLALSHVKVPLVLWSSSLLTLWFVHDVCKNLLCHFQLSKFCLINLILSIAFDQDFTTTVNDLKKSL